MCIGDILGRYKSQYIGKMINWFGKSNNTNSKRNICQSVKPSNFVPFENGDQSKKHTAVSEPELDITMI